MTKFEDVLATMNFVKAEIDKLGINESVHVVSLSDNYFCIEIFGVEIYTKNGETWCAYAFSDRKMKLPDLLKKIIMELS